MKTIPEIVDFYNDDKVFITTENRLDFTFSDLKKQTEWTVNFLNNNDIQKSDTVAIVLENGAEMATSFLSVASCCRVAPLNPTFTTSEFDFYLDDLNPKALIVIRDSKSPVIKIAKIKKIKIFSLFINLSEPSGQFTLISDENNTSNRNQQKLVSNFKDKFKNTYNYIVIENTDGLNFLKCENLNKCKTEDIKKLVSLEENNIDNNKTIFS